MKKLLSLFVLLVAIVTGAKADDVYKYQLNGANKEIINGTVTEGDMTYFSYNSSKHNFNTKFKDCTYDGVAYTSGLKMEGATNLSWTSTAVSTVVIVQSTWSSKTIKFDDTELAVADAASITGGRVYTIEDVAAGEHSVTRGSGESGVFAITVTEAGSSTTPKITASNASVTATESGEAATVEVPVTGAYLTGSTLTATLSGAPAGMSVALDQNVISEGAISATATVSYSATENANGTATLTFSDGTTSKDITITYKAQVVATELQTISEATTWDFSTDVTGAKQYTTDEEKNTEYVYADITELTYVSSFKADALAFKGEYPFRGSKNKYAQNGVLHFKTSVAGTIKVKFSDTGSSKSATAVKRYLQINGENTEYWTSRENNGDEPYDAQLNVETGEIAVAAGDIYLSGSSPITYSYVIFTPAPAPTTETITISGGVTTYVTENALDFSEAANLSAYAVTAVDADNKKITTAKVTQVPAGTPLLIKGTSEDIAIISEASAITNQLVAATTSTTQNADGTIYVYSKSAGQFKKLGTATIPAGKCYLVIEGVSFDDPDGFSIDFEGEATAITNVNGNDNANSAAPVKVIKGGKLYIGNYNVAGQQVK